MPSYLFILEWLKSKTPAENCTLVPFCDEQKRSNVPVTQATAELLSSSACVGADCLMKHLGNYCRNQDIKTAITVGVVGKPLVHSGCAAVMQRDMFCRFPRQASQTWERAVWSTVWNERARVMLAPLPASPSKCPEDCWDPFVAFWSSKRLGGFQVPSTGAFGQTHQASGLPWHCHGDLDHRRRHDSSQLCENWTAGRSSSSCWSHPSTLQQDAGMQGLHSTTAVEKLDSESFYYDSEYWAFCVACLS